MGQQLIGREREAGNVVDDLRVRHPVEQSQVMADPQEERVSFLREDMAGRCGVTECREVRNCNPVAADGVPLSGVV